MTCPLSAGEPDTPLLKPNDMKVERNTFYVPLQPAEEGASPLQHFYLRYRKVTDASSTWIFTLFLQSSSSLIPAFRMKMMPSGKKYSCRPVLTPYPSKTWPLGQNMKWRSQQSTPTAPRSPAHSTLPLERNLVCNHEFLIAVIFMAPGSVDVN